MSAGTDTALGLTESRTPLAIAVKVVLYALVAVLFAGPLIALLVGAFGEVSDPTELSVIPTRPTLSNFGIAIDYGVLKTPGLVINGKLVSSGRIPAPQSVADWIRAAG